MIKGRFLKLKADREPFLTRARACAKITIPSLIPEEGHTRHAQFIAPWQSKGAEGINNLASKLVLTLLPPSQSFFRFQIDEYLMDRLQADPGVLVELEKALSKAERQVLKKIQETADRVTLDEALKHLIVGGNVLLFKENTSTQLRMFPLYKYVVRRSPEGRPVEIIVEDGTSYDLLSEEVREACGVAEDQEATDGVGITVYTRIWQHEGKWKVVQEINDIEVPGSEGTYPKAKCPWFPLRWRKIDGESYGRGYVEEFYGDLNNAEGLSEAITKGSLAAAKVIFLRHPNGTTKKKDIAGAPNGAVIDGSKSDIDVLQMEKYNDFRVALETLARIEERLSRAFLLNSSIQRKGERVTAEEIRLMASDLEDALGGIYGALSQEFQLPYLNVLMGQLEKEGKMPEFPKDSISPSIVTGMEALGRGQDLTKIQTFLQMLQILGPQVIQQYLKPTGFIGKVGSSLSLEIDSFVRSEEEVQQMMAKQQEQAMAQQLAGPLIQQGGQLVKEGMKQDG